MKKTLILICCLSVAYSSSSQETNTRNEEARTLISNGGGVTGGFFMMQPKFSVVNDQTAFMGGMSMAMVLGHQFNMGLAINFLLSDVTVDYNPSFYYQFGHLEMVYGGIYLEPVFFNKSPVHFTLPVVAGPGAVSINNGSYFESIDTDMFWFVEPGATVELNVTKILRFDLGASYRFIFDTQLPYGIGNEELSNYAISAGFKIGLY